MKINTVIVPVPVSPIIGSTRKESLEIRAFVEKSSWAKSAKKFANKGTRELGGTTVPNYQRTFITLDNYKVLYFAPIG